MSKSWLLILILIIVAVLAGSYLLKQNGIDIDGIVDVDRQLEDSQNKISDSEKDTPPKNNTSNNYTPVSNPVKTDDKTELTITKGTAMVTYTDSGFEPNTVLIGVTQSVQFTNQSDRAMRIASYPEGSYKGFSQSKSVGRGGTFIFSFIESGRWEYEDSNNPTYRGTVFVYPQP